MVVRDRRFRRKNREVAIIAFACLICLSAIVVGAKVLNDKNHKKNEDDKEIVNLNDVKKESGTDNKDALGTDTIKNDSDADKAATTAETENIIDNKEDRKVTVDNQDKEDITYEKNTTENQTENPKKNSEENVTEGSATEQKGDVIDVNAAAKSLTFGEDSSIKWPVKGNIVLDYSMDNTIYFPTLDSYKCNPAIIIQSEKGTNVCAGAKGIVSDVSTDGEIGNYIKVNVGSGYELTYGQLQNICVSVGDSVEPDTSIAQIADTTRYYRNEGTNLYFKMTRDGEPCDPTDFLE